MFEICEFDIVIEFLCFCEIKVFKKRKFVCVCVMCKKQKIRI